MSTSFSVILEDFELALEPLQEIVSNGQQKSSTARARIASVQAATLLLAASFEEFIREMAREYAVQVVHKASNVYELPDILLETAWRRTFETFSKNKNTGKSKRDSLEIAAKQARPIIDSLCAFIEGDIKQNIFDNLIHNENNMRPGQINVMFKVGGLSNMCSEACTRSEVKFFFETEDHEKAHGQLLSALENFFERRNAIAHSINSTSSAGPEEILKDLELFRALSKDICETLEIQLRY